ncbi:hypothetical protein NLJ89_g10883 [Agrocybe chaxingu]|uniref:Uncharacterized protein n=1 Tax=Agrocybe chaxingu TaxID=84603 RepID=A0A9W8JMY6_9AGAR|nr:hypothetical protein NLJ89_g10883 [Agrocybe chaxingu]
MDRPVQHPFAQEHFLGTLRRYLDREILSWPTRPLRVVLYGPRQVGKKTMATTVQKEFEKRHLQSQLLLTSASAITAWNRGQRPLDAFGAKLEYAVDDPDKTAKLKSIWEPYTFVYITEAEQLTSQALQLLSQSIRRAKETDEVFGNVSLDFYIKHCL